MKNLLWLTLIFLIALPLQAQDNPTSYEIALQRIEEARVSGATELNLSNLGLTELPPEIGELDNLKMLYLLTNRVSSLPSEIGKLTNLQELNLSANQLRNLPPEIGQLTSLQELNLSANQLRNLPPEIGQLSNLHTLNLAFNQLNSLPPEIGQLNSLCRLILVDNNFTHLPNSLRNLTQLADSDCRLILAGNPLISPPPEVIEQGIPAVLAYLRNQALWHIRKMMIYAASVVGLLAIVVLGLVWRYRGRRKTKVKRI